MSSHINIKDSVIGQLAVGNKGQTVMNHQTKKYAAGATDASYHISGGNFTQANIGGEAEYNNRGSNISGANSGSAGGLTISQLAFLGEGKAEEMVMNVLRTGIDSVHLKALLQKGFKLEIIEKALCQGGRVSIDDMVESMLSSDAELEENN